ncbi:hypothetical protein Glove_61g6 [Diversispora epigaea]|uniref:Uncharacterized protein n=1 Tax=Diversispora epigaea TaxID=1348612 RepID=A0A397JBK6_9GLOM|nr:hypothetical protein Glove_61g6 [Diversispora epigaea]
MEETRDSFIFSLKTSNMKNSILSRVLKMYFDYAIYNIPETPEFSFGATLCLIGNLKTEKKCHCSIGSLIYSNPIRSDDFSFSVEEYEVFKISPNKNHALPTNDKSQFHNPKETLKEYLSHIRRCRCGKKDFSLSLNT